MYDLGYILYIPLAVVAVCPAGSFSSKNQCTLCPLGQYQPARGQSRCLRCPNGRTTLLEGSRRPSECVVGNVNECQTSVAECGPNEVCRDTPEYYRCDCKEGFTRQEGGNCTGTVYSARQLSFPQLYLFIQYFVTLMKSTFFVLNEIFFYL